MTSKRLVPLPAGPELDVKVAEAMGWEWYSYLRRSFLIPPWGYEARETSLGWKKGKDGPEARIEQHFTERYQNWRIPEYSTDSGASAGLKKWLRERVVFNLYYTDVQVTAHLVGILGGPVLDPKVKEMFDVSEATEPPVLARFVVALHEAGLLGYAREVA